MDSVHSLGPGFLPEALALCHPVAWLPQGNNF